MRNLSSFFMYFVSRELRKKQVYISSFLVVVIVELFIPLSCFAKDLDNYLSDLSKKISQRVALSSAEKQWINSRHNVRIRVGEVPPYHYILNGVPRGLSVDFLKVILSAFSIEHEFISNAGGNFAEAIVRLESGDGVDLFPTFRRSMEREKKILFTNNYVHTPWVIFSRKDGVFIEGLVGLQGKKVSVESGFLVSQKLSQDYPKIILIECSDTAQALKALASGQVDAYVGDLSVGTFVIQRDGLSNLKIAAPTEYPATAQAMGIRRDWPELTSIINKALDCLTPEENQKILNNSLSVKFEYGIDREFISWISFGVLISVVGLVLFVNRKLKCLITEKNNQQRETMKLKNQLETALASLSDGLFITDVRGDFTHLNDSFARISRCKDGEELRKKFKDCPGLFTFSSLEGNLVPVEQEVIARALRGEKEVGIEYVVKRNDTNETWVESYSFSPIIDENHNIIGSIAVVRDVTEVKKVQKELIESKNAAEVANKAKSEFLANMSHEIRTPLSGILGMLNVLSYTEQTDEQKEYVLAAVKSAKRLTRLLSDILDISKVEADKLVIVDHEFSSSCLRDTIVELFSSVATEKGITLEFDLDRTIPLKLIGDETRVCQILLNLVGNAIKFTDKGSVTVSAFSVCNDARKNLQIIFTIRDTGIGLSDDQLSSIFEPFVQVDGSYTRRFQGAGLGLSITKKLVSLMQGNLTIESSIGAGTTVYVSLPFKSVQPNVSVANVKCDEHLLELIKSKAHVLLVEDDETCLISTKKILEKFFYKVSVARDGQKAIDVLGSNYFDVIFMDIQMPILDGVAATKIIRNTFASGKSNIPIIAITAYAMDGDKEKFLAVGMNDYIVKPLSMIDLENVICRVMKANFK